MLPSAGVRTGRLVLHRGRAACRVLSARDAQRGAGHLRHHALRPLRLHGRSGGAHADRRRPRRARPPLRARVRERRAHAAVAHHDHDGARADRARGARERPFRVPDALETLAERLRAAGWDTAAFVSAFVLDHRYRLDQGFDTYGDDTRRARRTRPRRPDATGGRGDGRGPRAGCASAARIVRSSSGCTTTTPTCRAGRASLRHDARPVRGGDRVRRRAARPAARRHHAAAQARDARGLHRRPRRGARASTASERTASSPTTRPCTSRSCSQVPACRLARERRPRASRRPGADGPRARRAAGAARASRPQPRRRPVRRWRGRLLRVRGPHLDYGWATIEGVRTPRWKYTAGRRRTSSTTCWPTRARPRTASRPSPRCAPR